MTRRTTYGFRGDPDERIPPQPEPQPSAPASPRSGRQRELEAQGYSSAQAAAIAACDRPGFEGGVNFWTLYRELHGPDLIDV